MNLNNSLLTCSLLLILTFLFSACTESDKALKDNLPELALSPTSYDSNITALKNLAKEGTFSVIDANNSYLEYMIESNATYGEVELILNSNKFTYIPNAEFVGDDSFTFKVFDGDNYSNLATVYIKVVDIDTTAPTFVIGSTHITDVNENQIFAIVLNAQDDISDVTYAISEGDSELFELNSSGRVTFKIAPDFEAVPTKISYTFTATATDSEGNFAIQTVTINIVDVDESIPNTPPVAYTQHLSTDENVALSITLTGHDDDGDKLTYTIVTSPSHGILSGIVPNITYTPAMDYNGSDGFAFKVNDTQIDSAINSIIITVNKVVVIGLSSGVKQTGQTISYYEDGTTVFDQSIKDDGYYEAGVTPSYIRASDIVTDELRGLMWQDDIAAQTVSKQWQSDDNELACRQNIGSAVCFDTTGDTATTYCSTLSLGGFEDWRLPTSKELEDIRDFGRVAPAIDTTYFQNTNRAAYWTSTSMFGSEYLGWTVDFSQAFIGKYSKDTVLNVRCVRDSI